MSVIKIDKKMEHHTDQVELAIKISCLVEGIHLSKTEMKVLAFYVVYGIKEATEKILIKGKSIKNAQTLRNIKSKLCRLGFLKRDDDLYKTYELNLDENFSLEENVITMLIKIDRS